MPQVKIENLTFIYKGKRRSPNVTVFDNLNVTFESDKTTVIMGASGSGKSTLIKSILGITPPSDGYIYFDNEDVTYDPIYTRNVSYVSQELALYPHFSVYKNIAFPLVMQGVPAEEIKARVLEMAKKLKIEHCLTRKPRQLSLGQNQRVAIARAIIKRPDVYVFDEPFSNLDKEIAYELRKDLKQLLSELNGTCIFVTHNAEDALLLADNIIVLDEGKLIANGTANDVYHSEDPVVKILFGK